MIHIERNRSLALAASLLLVVAGCGTDMESGRAAAAGGDYATTTTAAGTESTFDHPAALGGTATTAREALARMVDEGPPAYTARVHSCRKMRYATLGHILSSLGVDLDATEATSAGAMYRSADQALGAPNFAARIGETTDVTVAVSSRTFDIFVQAAPEILERLPNQERCMVGGVGARVFDDAGECNRDGLSCLIGEPASDAHVALCNDFARRAADPAEGRAIAVAAVLSAAHTCE